MEMYFWKNLIRTVQTNFTRYVIFDFMIYLLFFTFRSLRDNKPFYILHTIK